MLHIGGRVALGDIEEHPTLKKGTFGTLVGYNAGGDLWKVDCDNMGVITVNRKKLRLMR